MDKVLNHDPRQWMTPSYVFKAACGCLRARALVLEVARDEAEEKREKRENRK